MRKLIKAFDIKNEDLIANSYGDMLLQLKKLAFLISRLVLFSTCAIVVLSGYSSPLHIHYLNFVLLCCWREFR
jgi:hypothetical protein